MTRIGIGEALGKGLRTGFFFGLLVGLQEGHSAISITRSRMGDVSITGLAKLAHVFFTPVLADVLIVSLLALIPALVLRLWFRFPAGEAAEAERGFDALLAASVGGLVVFVFAAFKTFTSFTPEVMLQIGSVFGLLRFCGLAVLAAIAFHVIARRFISGAAIPALVLTTLMLALPAVPISYWGLRNDNHPLGGRNGFFLGAACTAVAFIVLTVLLFRLLGNSRTRRWTVHGWFAVSAAVLVSGTFLPLVSAPSIADQAEAMTVPSDRNVVLFTVDTLRADALDLDAPETSTTPHLAQLAAAATSFDDTQAQCPWTLPSLCSMMTSIYPSGQGMLSARNRLDSARRTLADELGEAGYLTAAVVCNAWLTDDFGLHQGFRIYTHVWEEGASEYWQDAMWIRVARRFKPGFLEAPNTHDSAEMVDRAIRFLEQNAASNFFLWVHVIDPHDPYAPLGRYRAMAGKGYRGALPPKRSGSVNMLRRGKRLEVDDRRHLRTLYDLEVRYTDEQFGRLMNTLHRLGLFEKTMVVFTSDHGEEFWEHENVGHGHTLYDELTRVPLIVKPPGGAPPVERVGTQVRLIDISPTILDYLELPAPIEGQGESLRPLMEGEPGIHRPSFAEALIYFGEKKSIDDGRYRLILSPNSGSVELFDLAEDPGERRNIAEEHPEITARLRQELTAHLQQQEEYRQSLASSGDSEMTTLDDRMKNRLRALGYLQ